MLRLPGEVEQKQETYKVGLVTRIKSTHLLLAGLVERGLGHGVVLEHEIEDHGITGLCVDKLGSVLEDWLAIVASTNDDVIGLALLGGRVRGSGVGLGDSLCDSLGDRLGVGSDSLYQRLCELLSLHFSGLLNRGVNGLGLRLVQRVGFEVRDRGGLALFVVRRRIVVVVIVIRIIGIVGHSRNGRGQKGNSCKGKLHYCCLRKYIVE